MRLLVGALLYVSVCLCAVRVHACEKKRETASKRVERVFATHGISKLYLIFAFSRQKMMKEDKKENGGIRASKINAAGTNRARGMAEKLCVW